MKICPKCGKGKLVLKFDDGWYCCDWCDYEITVETYDFCKGNDIDLVKMGN